MSRGEIQSVATAEKKIEAMLGRMDAQLAKVLPTHITPERMARVTMNGLTRNPKLLECTPRSIAFAVMLFSELGLEPNGPLGEGYLIPHWNGKTQSREATAIPGYQGILKLARQSHEIANIFPYIVYEKDMFKVVKGSDPHVEHEPFIGDAGLSVGFYCIVKFTGGGEYFEFMTRAQAEEHRDRFATAKDRNGKVFGPWVDHFDRMALKTVIIRTLKMCPKSTEMAKGIQAVEWEQDRTGTVTAPMPEETPLPEMFPTVEPRPALAEQVREAQEENRQPVEEQQQESNKRGPNTSTCVADIDKALEILGAEDFHEALNDLDVPAAPTSEWPLEKLREARSVLMLAVDRRA